jgi:hypothetical protein
LEIRQQRREIFALKSLLPNAKNFTASFDGRRKRALSLNNDRFCTRLGFFVRSFSSAILPRKGFFSGVKQQFYSFSVVFGIFFYSYGRDGF